MKRNPHSISIRSLYIWLALLSVICFPACQQLCQQPGQALTTITNQQFRLVSTTDPSVQNLSNTNFEIIQFSNNYTGSVFKVQNNEEFNTPALTFTYNVSPSTNQLSLTFSEPADNSGGGDGVSTPTQVGSPEMFQYNLTNELDLTAQGGCVSQGGQPCTYRFVPFQGIVLPDQQCTF